MKTYDTEQFSKYIYWLDKTELDDIRAALKLQGYSFSRAMKTPCEVLKAKGKKLVYGTPGIWSLVCKRQGSWYRDSNKNGKYMLVSDHLLDEKYDNYLDVTIRQSDFTPEQLPDRRQLSVLVRAPEYQSKKPQQWEQVKVLDKVMFKTLFTFTQFWGWGDNMKKHWLNQRANHANFIAKQYTTTIDDEDVAYSVTDNDGVCSSCVEFFNVIQQQDRKLVRACPGAITFGGVERDIYYDVKPAS
jgi:hypothetical protein